MNLTSNLSVFQPACSTSKELIIPTVFKMAGYCALLLLALFGNTAIIAIIYRDVKMRTTTNYWITNTAISDLLFPFLATPYRIVQIFTGDGVWLIEGNTGSALSKLTLFLGDVSTAVSIQSMVFIAIERFCAVKFPFLVASLQPKMRNCIPITWITAFVLHSPYFYTARLQSQKGKTLRTTIWAPAFDHEEAQTTYVSLIFVVLYALPLAALLSLYTSIVLHLKKTKTSLWNKQETNIHRKRRHKKIQLNTLRMSVAVVFVFFICFSPLVFLTLCLVLGVLACTSKNVWFSVFFMAQSYPSWNPIIYFIFNSNFRSGLQSLFAKVQKKRPWFKSATSLTARSFQSLRARTVFKKSTKKIPESNELAIWDKDQPRQ